MSETESSTGTASIDRYDQLIDILCRLRLVIEEVAEEVNGEDVQPSLRGQPAPFAKFDAGHLSAAETIIRSSIDADYEGLKRFETEDVPARTRIYSREHLAIPK